MGVKLSSLILQALISTKILPYLIHRNIFSKINSQIEVMQDALQAAK